MWCFSVEYAHSPASKQANKKSNASDGVSFSQTQSRQWKQIKKCAREKGHKVQVHMDSSDCYIYTCIVWFPCVSCKVMQGGLFLFPMGIQTIKGGVVLLIERSRHLWLHRLFFECVVLFLRFHVYCGSLVLLFRLCCRSLVFLLHIWRR